MQNTALKRYAKKAIGELSEEKVRVANYKGNRAEAEGLRKQCGETLLCRQIQRI